MLKLTTALLAASALAGVAHAQAAASTDEVEALRAQVQAMQAQIQALAQVAADNNKALADTNKKLANQSVSWKGMPETSGPDGFKFKLNGELQYDFGQINNPGNRIVTPNLGFTGRSRRLLIGASGSLPGDFSYNFQFNFAEGVVDYEDVIFEWAPHRTPLTFTVGYFYPFSSLDNMTSNRFIPVLERSQLNDAFNNGRRLGFAVTYVNPKNDFRIQLGAFNQGINGNAALGYSATSTVTPAATPGGTPTVATSVSANNAGLFDRTGYQGSARVVWSPKIYGGQAHLAASFQWREFATDARGLRYRARPFVFTTDQRFIDTTVAGSGDTIVGLEALYIWGPFHVQGEGQYLHVRGYRPGYTVTPPQAITGTAYPQDADFASGYIEGGWWITGETRGYKNGKIDRTKILHPVSEGGWGGLQLAGRVDYLNLSDQVGNTAANSAGLVNGGRQIGYIGVLNYWPIDYVRIAAQYTHAEIRGGPLAAQVVPLSTQIPAGREYSTDAFALRAQIDF
ncbi:MAG: hypothetical protein JO290_01790 [Sphingomonadaceae bacterium]|nr:hypothetical protein [Sphingomonadaceae bacterium]